MGPEPHRLRAEGCSGGGETERAAYLPVNIGHVDATEVAGVHPYHRTAALKRASHGINIQAGREVIEPGAVVVQRVAIRRCHSVLEPPEQNVGAGITKYLYAPAPEELEERAGVVVRVGVRLDYYREAGDQELLEDQPHDLDRHVIGSCR